MTTRAWMWSAPTVLILGAVLAPGRAPAAADREGEAPAEPASRPARQEPRPPDPGHHAATPEQIEFFEKKVRPVLAEHCYRCHSADAKKLKGGLRLDSRGAVLQGGDTGPAVVPGEPDKSRL